MKETNDVDHSFVLQKVQPALLGLMDGSVSTLAPLFATAGLTHSSPKAFLVGLPASTGAGISMGLAEALSDDGAQCVFTTMYRSIIFLLLSVGYAVIPWHYNLDEAKTMAQKEHRHILLNFSGSDWCGPCIRMHHEIFAAEVFENMADSSLVMVNADFPRMKKNQLPTAQQQLNDAMADKYNPKGKFPYTVLLTSDGKVLKAWDGFPGTSPDAFAHEVQTIIDKYK